MRKLLMFLSLLVLAAGCKKKNPVSYSWKIGGDTYRVMNVLRDGSTGLTAYNDQSSTARNQLHFLFGQLPASAGSYTIDGNLPYVVGSGAVAISMTRNSDLIYYSSPYNTEQLTVMMNGRKLFFSLPPVWMYQARTGDSVLLSAQILEY